jgi:F-type H+-transporting ATPase subunit b
MSFMLVNFLATVGGNENAIARLASEFHVKWSLLLAQTLNFSIMAYILYRFAFLPLMKVVEKRQLKIAESLRKADEIKNDLEKAEIEKKAILQDAMEKANGIINRAHSEAEIYEKKELIRVNETLEKLRTKENERIVQDYSYAMRDARKQLKKEAAFLAQKLLESQMGDIDTNRWTAKAVRNIKAK